MPCRCGMMMCLHSSYSRPVWDGLMEALIDPEHRKAYGRIAPEPETDINVNNVIMLKLHSLEVKITHYQQKYLFMTQKNVVGIGTLRD